MRYLVISLIMLVVGCSSRENSLQPDTPLPKAASLAAAGEYGWPSDDDVFTDMRHYNVRSLMIGGETVLDEGRGLYGLRYIYGKSIGSGNGYTIDGRWVLTGQAENPGFATTIGHAPTEVEFNALVDKYNKLLSALQDIDLIER